MIRFILTFYFFFFLNHLQRFDYRFDGFLFLF